MSRINCISPVHERPRPAFPLPIKPRIAALLLALIGSIGGIAQAQQFPNYPEPDLPQMEPCAQRIPVPLPEKWQAVTLMAPYLYQGNFPDGANLRIGRFTYDSSVGAMRAAVYRVGANNVVDLLISHDKTWLLGGSWDKPTCAAQWGENLEVPGRVWQDGKAECVGTQRTAPTIHTGPKVNWWKQPSPVMDRGAEGQAGDWFWFDQKGYPTRTFFWGNHSGLPAVLSEYTFSNFYSFEPVAKTQLASLVATCEGQADLPILEEADRIAYREKEQAPRAGHPKSVSELIPGLSYEACGLPEVKPPHWPQETYISSFSTAAKFATPKPLTTSVYYNPAGPNLRTRLHKIENAPNNGPPALAFSDALLLDKNSWGIDFSAQPPFDLWDCGEGPHTSIPGAPHPDWGARGGCQCMGIIKNNSVLSPDRTTQVISCPLPDYSGDTLFWMWYTVEEPPKPIVFLQSRADITIGTGLSLADYYSWQAPTTPPIPPDIYTTPQPDQCQFPPSSAPTPPGACLKCHNPSINSGHGASKWRF
jgi:hypothetical protein